MPEDADDVALERLLREAQNDDQNSATRTAPPKHNSMHLERLAFIEALLSSLKMFATDHRLAALHGQIDRTQILVTTQLDGRTGRGCLTPRRRVADKDKVVSLAEQARRRRTV